MTKSFQIGERTCAAIIPLRSGSKGLPNKNILKLAGKPLYRHTLDQALRVIGKSIISTDIPEILQGDFPPDCLVLERPASLATDTTPMNDVLTHVCDELEGMKQLPDIAVLLQATSPLRQDKNIIDAINLFANNKYELVISGTQSDSSILKHGFSENGKFTPVCKPEYCFQNRQELPKIVRPNGAIFVFSPATFRKNGGLASQSIGIIEMHHSHSFDIDDEADLAAAEAVILGQSAGAEG